MRRSGRYFVQGDDRAYRSSVSIAKHETAVVPNDISGDVDEYQMPRTRQRACTSTSDDGGRSSNPKHELALLDDLECTWMVRSDIVLDFFAGSGTTAEAVCELNAADGGDRRYSSAFSSPRTTADRDARAAERAGIRHDRRNHQGTHPRARVRAGTRRSSQESCRRRLPCTYGSTRRTWRTCYAHPTKPTSRNSAGLEDSVKPGRSGEDLLFQVLLDWGLELAMPITVGAGRGHEVFVVEDGALVACFDDEVSRARAGHRQAAAAARCVP